MEIITIVNFKWHQISSNCFQISFFSQIVEGGHPPPNSPDDAFSVVLRPSAGRWRHPLHSILRTGLKGTSRFIIIMYLFKPFGGYIPVTSFSKYMTFSEFCKMVNCRHMVIISLRNSSFKFFECVFLHSSNTWISLPIANLHFVHNRSSFGIFGLHIFHVLSGDCDQIVYIYWYIGVDYNLAISHTYTQFSVEQNMLVLCHHFSFHLDF